MITILREILDEIAPESESDEVDEPQSAEVETTQSEVPMEHTEGTVTIVIEQQRLHIYGYCTDSMLANST